MTTKTANSRKNVNLIIKNYLLDALKTEDHDLVNPSDVDLFKYASNRFNTEYGYMIERVGKVKACKEWLLGLTLNVEYTYFDIENLLTKWGVLTGKESENKLQDELDLYWDRLAIVLVKNFK